MEASDVKTLPGALVGVVGLLAARQFEGHGGPLLVSQGLHAGHGVALSAARLFSEPCAAYRKGSSESNLQLWRWDAAQ